jgi:rRNA small subunit pseudouridine methyltransferase Nep1
MPDDQPATPAPAETEEKHEEGSQGQTSKKRPLPPSSVDPPKARVRKTLADKENQRRLIVVLENACLETYKVSSGPSSSSGGRRKKDGEERWTLLNCDDHQHVLAKMGRQVATARPDITHQVRTLQRLPDWQNLELKHDCGSVPLDFARFTHQQSRPAASLHSHK